MSCPCLYIKPCSNNCTCVNPSSSYGCTRCCSYGSVKQRKTRAKFLSFLIDKNKKQILETEKAWAAGFFDGEGYIGFCPCGKNKKYRRIQITVYQIDKQVLERFEKIIPNLGKIYGPYKSKNINNKPYYEWAFYGGIVGAKIFFSILSPYLSPIKYKQCFNVLKLAERYDKRIREPGRKND